MSITSFHFINIITHPRLQAWSRLPVQACGVAGAGSACGSGATIIPRTEPSMPLPYSIWVCSYVWAGNSLCGFRRSKHFGRVLNSPLLFRHCETSCVRLPRTGIFTFLSKIIACKHFTLLKQRSKNSRPDPRAPNEQQQRLLLRRSWTLRGALLCNHAVLRMFAKLDDKQGRYKFRWIAID